ncbi:MAG: DEAD/DEAH box helicase family protein [Candidatus Sumerlaeia bacterium]|nr:DEAD/DEAH box helicase family protein [Candidatus Sumerlaeia bacterium]
MAKTPQQAEIPVAPVKKPVLCSPYEEPTQHYRYDTQTGDATEVPGRRRGGYYYQTQRANTGQGDIFGEEEWEDLPLVNALREDVRKWRERGYRDPDATTVTRQLFEHWRRADRPRRLFFCQIEAVETVVYLTEILGSGKKPRWKAAVSPEDFETILRGDVPSFLPRENPGLLPKLHDLPHDGGSPLRRYGCKMATGSGKTVVMAMTIAWAFCNRGRNPGDERFPNAALVVCPNLTVKERLSVLNPEHPANYFQAFDIVPSGLVPELKKGRVLVTNWHWFAPESPHSEGGKSYAVVNKGEESPEAFAKNRLGDLADRGPIMVLNDEAHHAYRPAPVGEKEKLSAEEKAEREEATVWVSGLDKLNAACGVKFCVDLSATPFYLHGSGYAEGSPFPWLVSDFGLVEAIESGITKIPRLPVADTTGRPDPRYFRLWKKITDDLEPGEKLPGGKPKPAVVWREAEDALATLMSQWKERFEYLQSAAPGQERVPPVLIIVCDNVDIAEEFYRNISGEEKQEVIAEEDLEDEDADEPTRKKGKKPKTKTVFGRGKIFPDLFSNREGFRPTLRIDTKLLGEAETAKGGGTKAEAAEELRRIVSTVGRVGEPGEQVRCVVSVQMLTEGWDANNVTHILGLRAFGSQLLCEQVVGRGLRRMDYTPDPETGLLTEEYVDIYGIPFSIIPFKGRATDKPAPEDKPKQHVKALPDRAAFEIRFPVVEGFVFALEKNLVRADVAKMEALALEPDEKPTATFVKPQVGYQLGGPGLEGGFAFSEHDREEYYRETHLQTIKFEIARQVVWNLTQGQPGGTPKLRLRGRHQLFPQVLEFVDEYVRTRVRWNGCRRQELGLEVYVQRIVERLTAAIEPDDTKGEPPLLPILNRYKGVGSTAEVDFKTVKPCFGTVHSHVNQVVADTATWEQSAAFRLEQAASRGTIECYVKNRHRKNEGQSLGLVVPYEWQGLSHSYEPDFVVRVSPGLFLLLEIKGQEDDQDRAKHQAAQRWVSAVNNWGQMGRWDFLVCHDPKALTKMLERFAAPEG